MFDIGDYMYKPILLVALLAGCCENPSIVEPSAVTLQEAMKSVGEGLVAMQKAENGLKTGLIPSEVSVTFNISASKVKADKLYVEVGAPASAPVTGKLGGEASTTYTANRGNQITIKFSNLLLAGDKTLVKDKSPEDMKNIFKSLDLGGINIYSTKPSLK